MQTAHKQWYFGKSLDGFTPIGPCIVTADAFADYPPRLGIRSFVNEMCIRDSFTTGDGEVIFKKYSPMGELSGVTAQYVDVLSKCFALTAFVSDLSLIHI